VTGNEGSDEELTDLRYVGPATASTLAEQSVSVGDVREKRVSYQMLVDAGINAGVATKIRRWHSLPWTFDGEEHHLDRRSKNVRHLQDDERAWVAASSDWREDADASDDADGEEHLTDDDWEREDDGKRDEADDRPVLTAGDWAPAGEADDSASASSDAEAGSGGAGGSGDDPLTESDWTPDDAGAETAETDGSGSAEARESAWRRESRADPVTAVPGLDEHVAATLVDASVTSARRLATSDPEHVGKVLDLPTETVREWVDAASRYVAE